jgi:hypothetical protein
MALESLTFKEIKARPVICKLTRPAVARIPRPPREPHF